MAGTDVSAASRPPISEIKMTKKILSRLLLFLVCIPLILVIVLFLPYRSHLVLNIVVIIFSVFGAVEMNNMLKMKRMSVSTAEAAAFGGLIPLLMTLIFSLELTMWILPGVIALAGLWILTSSVFLPAPQLENFINRLAAGFTVLLYPGFFLAWICAMGKWDGIAILVFLLIPILGDSAAWAAGMLFGKNNRGIVNVSPNKSIAGFIGSLFASILTSTVAVYLFPDLFIPRFGFTAVSGIALGLIPGIAAIAGDLCESALKRSAGCKDSGVLIPGRGGVLDSVDSIALAAPCFYFIWMLFFTSV
jgi:phosphatidate cytidylyltransferase